MCGFNFVLFSENNTVSLLTQHVYCLCHFALVLQMLLIPHCTFSKLICQFHFWQFNVTFSKPVGTLGCYIPVWRIKWAVSFYSMCNLLNVTSHPVVMFHLAFFWIVVRMPSFRNFSNQKFSYTVTNYWILIKILLNLTSVFVFNKGFINYFHHSTKDMKKTFELWIT